MNREDFFAAMELLRPNAEWAVTFENDGFKLDWKDTFQSKPTDAEIWAALPVAELQKVQKERKLAYPPIGDQLDAIWKGGTAFEEMQAKCMEVKEQHPKPD